MEGGKRREEGGPEVGKNGSELRFFPALPTISRHFPPFPTSIFFAGQTQPNFGQRNDWQRNVVKESRNGAKNYGLLRIISRKSAKFHESSHRSGPWFGFPSPPRDGCPSGVVRWRETWSRLFGFIRVGACFKTTKDAVFCENPAGGGSFVRGQRWLGRYSPLRGCSDLAVLATDKIPHRIIPRSFQTGSRPFLIRNQECDK